MKRSVNHLQHHFTGAPISDCKNLQKFVGKTTFFNEKKIRKFYKKSCRSATDCTFRYSFMHFLNAAFLQSAIFPAIGSCISCVNDHCTSYRKSTLTITPKTIVPFVLQLRKTQLKSTELKCENAQLSRYLAMQDRSALYWRLGILWGAVLIAGYKLWMRK